MGGKDMNDQNTYREEEKNQAGPKEQPPKTEGTYRTEGAYQTYTGETFDPLPRKESNTFSVLSLVLGILSIVAICCCGSSLLFGIAAIVFAMIGRARTGDLDGMAIAGLVMGIIGAVLGVVGVMITALSAANLNDPSIRDILDEVIINIP